MFHTNLNIYFILKDMFPKKVNDVFNLLKQACQTGGPRAACGPIACLLRPAVSFYSFKTQCAARTVV